MQGSSAGEGGEGECWEDEVELGECVGEGVVVRGHLYD